MIVIISVVVGNRLPTQAEYNLAADWTQSRTHSLHNGTIN